MCILYICCVPDGPDSSSLGRHRLTINSVQREMCLLAQGFAFSRLGQINIVPHLVLRPVHLKLLDIEFLLIITPLCIVYQHKLQLTPMLSILSWNCNGYLKKCVMCYIARVTGSTIYAIMTCLLCAILMHLSHGRGNVKLEYHNILLMDNSS